MSGSGVRLGHLDFLNALPVYLGLELLAEGGEALPPFHLVRAGGDPVALNRLLAAGRIELAPASSLELARRPGALQPLPGLAIASRGPVRSVLLLSRVPSGGLDGRQVALPSNSATSAALLKLLARRVWGVEPRYVHWPGRPDPEAMLAGADAALIIGDAALVARRRYPDLHCADLGATWHAWTGLPMVFAVWAARTAWQAERPAEAAAVAEALPRAQAAGVAALPGLVAGLAARRGLPPAVLEDYFFRSLDLTFDAEHQRGLDRFLDLAREEGLAVSLVEGVAVHG